MADEVLSQSQIDALLAKNASPDSSGDVSPEVEALLSKGSEPKPESIFSKKVAAMAPRAEESPVETSSSGQTVEKSAEKTPEPPPIQTTDMLSILEGKEPSQKSAAPRQSAVNVKGPGQAAPGPSVSGGQAPDAVVKSLQMMMETFSLRIEKVEALFERVAALEKAVANIAQGQSGPGPTQGMMNVQHLEREIANIGNAVRSLTQSQRNNAHAFNNLERQLRDINQGLDGTPNYELRQTFECGHCGSRGHVAEYVTCTECGEETWWGWWPE